MTLKAVIQVADQKNFKMYLNGPLEMFSLAPTLHLVVVYRLLFLIYLLLLAQELSFKLYYLFLGVFKLPDSCTLTDLKQDNLSVKFTWKKLFSCGI
jgi:hypothetical protein